MSDDPAPKPDDLTPEQALEKLDGVLLSLVTAMREAEDEHRNARKRGDAAAIRAADDRMQHTRAIWKDVMAEATHMRSDRDHRAMREYQAAANRQAARVATATWVLSVATVVLALATIGLIWATLTA